jgi:glycosyltransferase involved in cell wall biosynthesis
MRRCVIVTSVLNGARYLEATLASVDAQTHGDWVHYIVDGGSIDGSQEIARRATEGEPRRRLITGPDRGMYDGIFKGFDQARADRGAPDDVCLWLNADDLLAPWALATMTEAFVAWDADWLTALPAQWDAEGRMVSVQPYAWYPRSLVRAGLFSGRGLGWIQQESTFFTRRLLDLVPSEHLDAIRVTRMAGDFLLWREFARHRPLLTLPTVIGGFRNHGGNASVQGLDTYYAELRQAGVILPPAPLGRLARGLYLPAAALATAWRARRLAVTRDREMRRHSGRG